MAFCPPSWARRCPAAWPARLSSDPKYIFAPNLWYSSFPELNATTGMPRSAAAFAAGPTCSTWASVTASPSTWLSIAFCTSVACSGAWAPFEYFRSTLCARAASSAPARIRSQNVSPGCSWVTIAIVNCSPPTLPPAPPPPADRAEAAAPEVAGRSCADRQRDVRLDRVEVLLDHRAQVGVQRGERVQQRGH